MQGWIEHDDDRGEVLVRRGRGLVTVITPLSEPDAPSARLLRVEIDCERPAGRPRAIRYRVHAVVPEFTTLAQQAQAAQSEGLTVEWTVRWIRHDWIPVDVPVTSLDLAADAIASLAELEIIAPAEADLDAEWAALVAEGSDGQPPADPS